MKKFNEQEKFLKGTPRYYALQGELKEGIVISINNTQRTECSFNCLHCGNKNAPAIDKKITLEEIKNILHSAHKKLGTKTLLLPGEGDPMLDKNLKEIIKTAYSLGITTVMFNTAYLITEDWAKFFKEHDVTLIISFTDYNEERYNNFVRKDAYDKVIKNINNIAKIYRGTIIEIKGKKVYRLAFNVDINATNFYYRKEIQDLSKELEIMNILNYPWLEGEAIISKNKLINKISYRELMKIVFEESENQGFSFVSPDMYCGMEEFGLSIGADGRLQHCPYRIEKDMAMSHINDYKIIEGYDLKKALLDRMKFWKINKVKVCSIRHGGVEFKEKLKDYILNNPTNLHS